MAEKIGRGRSTSDRRKSGNARRVPHTVHGGDMVGDKRKLPRMEGVEAPTSEGSRTVPIAAVAPGASPLEKRENGGGRRAMPKSMKVGEAG